MMSESARMNSAAEARFRIQSALSYSPSIRVIALDTPSENVVRRLARGSWEHTTFLTAGALSAAPEELNDLSGRPRNLNDELDSADLVVMVATPGGYAYAASVIGEACSLRRVMTTGLVVQSTSASEAALSKTLVQLRPWSLMVVIADPDDYIDHMLAALRG
jgi:hypothetical protein